MRKGVQHCLPHGGRQGTKDKFDEFNRESIRQNYDPMSVATRNHIQVIVARGLLVLEVLAFGSAQEYSTHIVSCDFYCVAKSLFRSTKQESKVEHSK